MDTIAEQRDALVVMGLTAAGFVLLVLTTPSLHYGLMLMPGDRAIWTLTRLVPGLTWIAIAAVILVARGTIVWTSAATAFSLALMVGSILGALIAPPDVDTLSLMSSIVYYSLISALLCLTVRNAALAGIGGIVAFVAQVMTDVAAHLGTGVLRIGW